MKKKCYTFKESVTQLKIVIVKLNKINKNSLWLLLWKIVNKKQHLESTSK